MDLVIAVVSSWLKSLPFGANTQLIWFYLIFVCSGSAGHHHNTTKTNGDEQLGRLGATAGSNQKKDMERRELTHVTTVVRNVPLRSPTTTTNQGVDSSKHHNTTAFQDYMYLKKKTNQFDANSYGKGRRVYRATSQDLPLKLAKQSVATSGKNYESFSDKSEGYQKVSDRSHIFLIFFDRVPQLIYSFSEVDCKWHFD